MSHIRVTIDRVVLKGISAGDERALVEALQTQLTDALSDPAQRAAWARSHRTPVLKLGQIPLETGAAGARKFGRQVGRAVSRGLKP
jgi:hypothetical protein